MLQVLSGENLLVLDPQGTFHPEHLQSWGCNLAAQDSHDYVDLALEAPGQVSPFSSFTASCTAVPDLTARSRYPGTMFRLALRAAAAAQVSNLSTESITASQFEQVLHEFAAAVPDLLLFLRHVNEISVYVKEDGEQKASLKHHCKATALELAKSELRQQHMVTVEQTDGSTSSRKWLKIVSSSRDDGVAVLLEDSRSNDQMPSLPGKVYSTMAVPFENTGLPVHINGAFYVSSDRRNLWEGEGDEGKVLPGL